MAIGCRFGQKAHVDTVQYVAQHMTPGSAVHITLGYNYTLPSGHMLLFQVGPNGYVDSYNIVGSWGTLGSPAGVSHLALDNGDAIARFSHYQSGWLI